MEIKLIDVVKKQTKEDSVFWNMMEDLAMSCDDIIKSTPLVKMSYAYARRASAAAMYIQGVYDKDAYQHAVAMFRGWQQNTNTTVDFQELAAADSIDFMTSYHDLISGLFVKKTIQIANEYELKNESMSDADLFSEVISTLHVEQNIEKNQASRKIEINKSNELNNKLIELIARVKSDINKSDRDELPNGSGEFGMTPNNPVLCNSIAGSRYYLERLLTLEGEEIIYNRIGSFESDVTPNPVDGYEIKKYNGVKLGVIYISPYQLSMSDKTPKNFKNRY